ncbi:hypothetical protein NXC24_PB00051 (plasmid) [Rhizobium sp. NXC24]|nr:hypothetical protein NXC24_PB00051 [Rhizobium sp. NXC24]
MLEISRKDCLAHSAQDQAFVRHLLRRLSALRLNVRNQTLPAAGKCLMSLQIHFGTRFALFAASSPIAWTVFGTNTEPRPVRFWSDGFAVAMTWCAVVDPRKCRDVLDAI